MTPSQRCAAMDPFEHAAFLWFGAFETTAALTALIVGAYSFLTDPTGRQDAGDISEIRVYTMWRQGMLLVSIDILLKIVVFAVQVANQRPMRTVCWTLALMAAPWAPFVDKVVAAFRATKSVYGIMRSRTARNELSSVMREYLMFGHHSLSATALAERLLEDVVYVLHVKTLAQVCRDSRKSFFETRPWLQQKMERDVGKQRATWVVPRRAMRHGPRPASRWTHRSSFRMRRIDLWTRMWTRETVRIVVDPFPSGAFSVQPLSEDVVKKRSLTTEWFGDERLLKRAYVLDRIDSCHRGYTLSQARVELSLPPELCARCQLATRAAVETFVESSSRAHINVCARQ